MSKYTTIYELTVNDKKYYIHPYIIKKCKFLDELCNKHHDTNIHITVHNMIVDFDVILTVLYDNDLGDYTTNEYINILNTLDHLHYTNHEITKQIIDKIKLTIDTFDDIINLNIKHAHKNDLVRYYFDNIYFSFRDEYKLDEIIKFIDHHHIMDHDVYNELIHRIALKIDTLNTLYSLNIQKQHKVNVLKKYLEIYTKNNKININHTIYLHEHKFDHKFEQIVEDQKIPLQYFEYSKETENIDCPDVIKFLDGLNIKIQDYKILFYHNEFNVIINNEEIGVSLSPLHLHEYLYTYALPILLERMDK